MSTTLTPQTRLELVRDLEERVCFVEQARDNAVAMRDECLRKSKERGESAGRRISQLVELVRQATAGMSTDTVKIFEQRLVEILDKEGR